jgi:site-specific recombinase XerD
VFPWPHCERAFYRQWHRIQDHAGISPHLKVHDLKRACGTRYAASGASAWVVQRRLDHSSIATSAHYINASREEREAVDRLAVPAAFLEDFSIPPAACGFTPEP